MIKTIELIAIFGFLAVWTALGLRYAAANRSWFRSYLASRSDDAKDVGGFRSFVAAVEISVRTGGLPLLFKPDPDPGTERLRQTMVDRLRPQLLIMTVSIAFFLVVLVPVSLVLLGRAIFT